MNHWRVALPLLGHQEHAHTVHELYLGEGRIEFGIRGAIRDFGDGEVDRTVVLDHIPMRVSQSLALLNRVSTLSDPHLKFESERRPV